jgi:hypothetical protein
VKSIYAGDKPTLGRVDADFLKQVIEAIIFASDEPISVKQINSLVEEATPSQVEKIIQNLNLEYRQTERFILSKSPAATSLSAGIRSLPGFKSSFREEENPDYRRLHSKHFL